MRAPLLLLPVLFVFATCGRESASPAATETSGSGVAAQTPSTTTEPARNDRGGIEWDALVHDFGTVGEGSKVEHLFRLRSTGEEDLTIINVSPECGCTAADLELLLPDGERAIYQQGTPIPVGGELVLATSFDSHGRTGIQDKKIRIYANVPGGVTTLTLKARVRAWLNVQPIFASVGQMSVLDTREATFTVSSVAGERFGLRNTRRTLPEHVSVVLEPLDADADGKASMWKAIATLGPGIPEGTKSYLLELITDRENPTGVLSEEGTRETFRVAPTISVRVVGRVSAIPPNISFVIMRPDQTVAQTVRVTSHDPDFELPEPQVEIVPLREGANMAFVETSRITTRRVEGENAWDIEVLLDGLSGTVDRTFHGRLRIRTGHPEEPALEVTISGIKRGS